MRKSRFTDSQIMDALRRVEAGIGVPDLCRDMVDLPPYFRSIGISSLSAVSA